MYKVEVTLKKEEILTLVSNILHYNLLRIPNQTIFNMVSHLSEALTANIKVFISVVLICNGLIKMILSANLLMRKMLAFPIAMVFLLLLLIYEIIQLFYTPSIYLALFILFDAIIVIVIWREYVYLKKNHKLH